MLKKTAGNGSQTLLRGLDILEAVACSPKSLAALSAALGLSKSTTQRLAASLVERGYLTLMLRSGYHLGPKLLTLGFQMQSQLDLVQIARPHLEALAHISEDTVHLGTLVDNQALYLDKIPGSRRIEISSRVGDRQCLTTTGIGKALILDDSLERWHALFIAEQPNGDEVSWTTRMQSYVACGYAFDLEENEDRIRCVSAPIRGADGLITSSISVSGAAQYMDNERMTALAKEVYSTARDISKNLGWISG